MAILEEFFFHYSGNVAFSVLFLCKMTCRGYINDSFDSLVSCF